MLILLTLTACDPNCDPASSTDSALTSLHRAALPKLAWMQTPSPGTKNLSDAQFPALLHDAAEHNDAWMVAHLAMLELMADREPAQQDQTLHLSTWGPFDDESTPFVPDELLLRVRSGYKAFDEDAGVNDSEAGSADSAQAGAEQDFEVLYTLSRRYHGDATTEQVVLWGGTQAAQSPHPSGVLVWDFGASETWDAKYNPVYQRLDRGRMAVAFADITTGDASATRQHLVAISWADFIPRSAAPGTSAIDYDQRWGHAEQAGQRVHFVTLAGLAQLDEDATTQLEQIYAECAFVDDGAGRADFVASNGDVPLGFRVRGEECWDEYGVQQFASATLFHDAGVIPPTLVHDAIGDASRCRLDQPWRIPDVTALPSELVFWLNQGANLGADAIIPLHDP